MPGRQFSLPMGLHSHPLKITSKGTESNPSLSSHPMQSMDISFHKFCVCVCVCVCVCERERERDRERENKYV